MERKVMTCAGCSYRLIKGCLVASGACWSLPSNLCKKYEPRFKRVLKNTTDVQETEKMNYIGSKYSLLEFLQTTIADVTGIKTGNGLVFADLFAGTGIVGLTFKSKGFKVISNDIQYYSYCLNKHYIENCIPLSAELVDYFNNLQGIEGFVFNNYCEGSGCGRNYFTDYNGKKCDAIRSQLKELFNASKISSATYYWYLASLINSIDKYANTASVYGAFLKHIKKSAQKGFVLGMLPIIEGVSGEVYNEDINVLIKDISGDILYP